VLCRRRRVPQHPVDPIIGKAAIREFVSGFADVPPGRLEIRHQVASANVVMNERTDYITLNGKSVTLPICGVFEVEDGRIKAWREYFDLGPAKAAYETT
jgi:limonene-1,2-epoxide hydrolase